MSTSTEAAGASTDKDNGAAAEKPQVQLITITIDAIEITVPSGTTILAAAKMAGLHIPTLCDHPDLTPIGACRLCMIEIDGQPGLQIACTYPITKPLKITTTSAAIRTARRHIIDLLLTDHYGQCYTCKRNNNCELQCLAAEYGIDLLRFGQTDSQKYPIDHSGSLVFDMNKCILCRRCMRACNELQNIGCLTISGRGDQSRIATFADKPLALSACIECGQCIIRCPTGALTEVDQTDEVWALLDDPTKHVVIQTAPAPRAAIGECFGLEPGIPLTFEMNTAIKRMGFDAVFDTNFSADLTIMEEGTELLHRLGSYLNGDKEVKIPLMTSCCPGWVSFVEQHFPELRDNLSTAKSPQQMFGAIAKSYFAEKLGVDRKDLVVVSIMPCLAKKYEASRPEFSVEGNPDVDYSIYTRELARLIRYANIDFNELPDGEFDSPLGESTGASVIFGTTGGVIEAACRTAYELYTKKNLDKVDFEELRGLEGIRSATIDFNGTPVKIGIAHGLGNARKLIEEVKNGTSPYHAIEVMACPGGCIGGGGQPFHRGRMEVLRRRAAALYREDANKPLRKSHENPYIQQLYSEYLGEPCGPKAHKLLHTHYIDRKEVIGMYIETEKSK